VSAAATSKPVAREAGAPSGPSRSGEFPPALQAVFQRFPALLSQRRALIVLVHAGLFAIAYALAFLARFEFDVPRAWLLFALATLPVVVAVELTVAGALSLFRGWWAYVGLRDMVGVVLSTTIAAVALLTLRGAVEAFPVPRGVILINWAFAILLAGGARVSVRLLREGALTPWGAAGGRERALILGAGDSGEALLRDLLSRRDGPEVVGLLDDDAAKRGRLIHRVPILGACGDLPRIAKETGATLALVAMPGAAGRQRRRVVGLAQEAGLRCQTLPSLAQIVDGRVSASLVRPVEIEDLLGRDPVSIDLGAIRARVEGRCVLVTGAAGSIGSELCRQLARFSPSSLVLLDRNESGLFWLERELAETHPAAKGRFPVVLGDITDAARVREVLAVHAPALVFHAAAYKHVPIVEANPGEAEKNNVHGTRVVADASEAAGVETFVLISTDKAVNPACAMGATKRRAERLLLESSRAGARTRFVSVRFGNVLGSAGSVVPVFQQQIARGGPVTVTHADMKRFFMTIPEAVQLVLQAAEMGRGGEIFVLDMGEPVRIMDLARDMIRLSGFTPGEDIEIEVTGVRPGEKLEEELSSQGESLLATAHGRIRVVREEAPPARLESPSEPELVEPPTQKVALQPEALRRPRRKGPRSSSGEVRCVPMAGG